MNTRSLSWMIPLAFAAAIPVSAQENPGHPTVLKGTIAHAPSKGVALIYGNNRQPAVLDANGAFTFSLDLRLRSTPNWNWSPNRTSARRSISCPASLCL